jgi:hypothetical protein
MNGYGQPWPDDRSREAVFAFEQVKGRQPAVSWCACRHRHRWSALRWGLDRDAFQTSPQLMHRQ